MVEVVMTEAQADAIRTAPEPIVLRGPRGDVLGIVQSPSSAIVENETEILERIRLRRNQPQQWHSTAEVLCHLMSLDASK
jgi:hypothetical protein